MRNSWLILAAGLAVQSAYAADSPAEAAKGFYAAYRTLPAGGVPNEKGRSVLEPYVSPGLDKLLMDAALAEASFAKANPDSPPLVEGDLFTSLFEGATSFEVKTCETEGNRAECEVALTYSDSSNKPVTWTDTARIVNTMAGGWRVDDIVYGGTWDFGNKGTLAQSLKAAMDAGGEE